MEGGPHHHKTDQPVSPDPPAPAPHSPAGVRLAFSRVFNLLAIILLLGLSFALWHNLPRARFGLPRHRLMHFLFFLPRTFVAAFFLAAVLTVLLDLLTRFVITPFVTLWYQPRVPNPLESGTLAFQIGPGEQIERMTPARWLQGHVWKPGTLVETSQRLWFTPIHGEAWSIPKAQFLAWKRILAPTWAFGLIRGFPDHLELHAIGRSPERFALLNSERFAPARLPTHSPSATPTPVPHV